MISIITPCRNAEKTIARTIESVLRQELKDFEYIIVDGLSTDGTVDIIKKYAAIHPEITYISEKDNSMTEALNKGLKMCHGDVVCSINADDEYMDDVLNYVEEEITKNGYDMFIGSTFFMKDGGVLFSTYPRFMRSRMLLSILDCSAPECSIFFKRDTITKMGGFDEKYKYTQDYELYIRMAKNKCKFGYTDKVVSKFYLSDEQYSTGLKDVMLDESCEYNEYPHLYRFLKETRINNAIKRVFRWVR